MGVQRGQNIITDGLVSYWDATNPKCYSTYNLLQYTEDFSNALWNKINSTIAVNNTIAPDGTLTADKIFENTTNGQHFMQQASVRAVGDVMTYSVYLKAAEKTIASINLNENNNSFPHCKVDLSNGTILALSGFINPTILDVGNGWYRISVTRITTSAGNSFYGVFHINSALSYEFIGNTAFGIYVWGAQLNRGKRALPYQPNLTTLPVSTAVNDLMKNANGTLTNGALANASEGIFTFDGVNDYVTMGNPSNLVLNSSLTLSAWVKLTAYSGAISPVIGRWNDNQRSYKMVISNTGNVNVAVSANGISQIFTITTSTLSLNTWYHLTAIYNQSATILQTYINGVLQNANLTGVVPSALYTGTSLFKLGNDAPTTNYFNGQLGMPKVYNRALSSQEVWQNYQATKDKFK